MEFTVYNDIIPPMRKLEQGEMRLSVPKVYFANMDEGFIFMENLKQNGFAMVDKSSGDDKMLFLVLISISNYILGGLTLDQTKAALIELANFHALSHKFLESYCLDKFKEDFPDLIRSTWFDTKSMNRWLMELLFQGDNH